MLAGKGVGVTIGAVVDVVEGVEVVFVVVGSDLGSASTQYLRVFSHCGIK